MQWSSTKTSFFRPSFSPSSSLNPDIRRIAFLTACGHWLDRGKVWKIHPSHMCGIVPPRRTLELNVCTIMRWKIECKILFDIGWWRQFRLKIIVVFFALQIIQLVLNHGPQSMLIFYDPTDYAEISLTQKKALASQRNRDTFEMWPSTIFHSIVLFMAEHQIGNCWKKRAEIELITNDIFMASNIEGLARRYFPSIFLDDWRARTNVIGRERASEQLSMTEKNRVFISYLVPHLNRHFDVRIVIEAKKSYLKKNEVHLRCFYCAEFNIQTPRNV